MAPACGRGLFTLWQLEGKKAEAEVEADTEGEAKEEKEDKD